MQILRFVCGWVASVCFWSMLGTIVEILTSKADTWLVITLFILGISSSIVLLSSLLFPSRPTKK